MAYTYTQNVTPANSAGDCLYQIKETLKSAGWTVVQSCLATGSPSASDLLTDGTTGASGFAATGTPWIILQRPTGTIRVLIRKSTATTANISHSFSAGYTGGSNLAAPTATDERFVWGTAASPATMVGTTHRLQLFANGSVPYDWGFFWYTVGPSAFVGMIAMDAIVSGTGDTSDVDPAIWIWGIGGSMTGIANAGGVGAGSSDNQFTTFRKGFSNESYAGVAAVQWQNSGAVVIPGLAGANVYTGNDDVYPILWARPVGSGTVFGIKGQSTLFRFLGTTRAFLDTLSIGSVGAKDALCVSTTVCIPWNGVAPTLV